MNNVAALALLMPVDLQAAAKAGRSPALTLMPLSFASILGGLVTLIGTPPNIIIAAFREKTTGEAFAMFDFAPVGGACAVAGIIFVALIGWRLIPKSRTEVDAGAELQALKEYITELQVVEDSKAISEEVSALDETAEVNDIQILGLIRNGQRLPGIARRRVIAAKDILVIQGGPEGIEAFAGALGLGYVEHVDGHEVLEGQDLEMNEVVVPPGARVEGRTVAALHLLRRYGVSVLGVSRQGVRFRERLARITILPGDILLMLGSADSLAEATQHLGCLPLAQRGLQFIQRKLAWLAIAIFVAAILLASFGLVYLPVALGGVVAAYVVFGVVPIRDVYGSIEWSVIVLQGALILFSYTHQTLPNNA